MPISRELLEIVRCPKCLGRVEEKQTASGAGLVCHACKLLYPVVNEIPNFLVDEAQRLEA